MNNIYNTISLPFNTPTVINALTVPARSGYSLKGLIVWCEADCDIEVKINVDTVSGGRLTGTNPTMFLDFSASPYGIGAADIVMVLATTNADLTPPASYPIYSTILVEQL